MKNNKFSISIPIKLAHELGTIIAALIPIGLIIWLITSIKSCFAG